MKRLILPQDILKDNFVPSNDFDVLVTFPDGEPVTVPRVQAEWSVAAFVDQLRRVCVKKLRTQNPSLGDVISAHDEIIQNRKGPYLLITSNESQVISVVHPYVSIGSEFQDLTALGEYGICQGTKLKLVGTDQRAMRMVVEDVDNLRKQYHNLREKERECAGILAKMSSERAQVNEDALEKRGLGKHFVMQCKDIVRESVLQGVTASNVFNVGAKKFVADEQSVIVHWKNEKQIVSLNHVGASGGITTCGHIAHTACMYFEQDINGVMLQEFQVGRPLHSQELGIWASHIDILDAIAAGGSRHFRLFVKQLTSEVVTGDDNEENRRVDMKSNLLSSGRDMNDEQETFMRLRRKRIRRQWVLSFLIIVLLLVLRYLDTADMNTMGQSIASSYQITTTARVRQSVYGMIFSTSPANMPVSNTQLLKVLSTIFDLYDNSRFYEANKAMKRDAVYQHRVVNQAQCQGSKLMTPFLYPSSTYIYADVNCTSCSLYCAAYYGSDTKSAAPYATYESPFIFEQDASSITYVGRLGTYDRDSFVVDDTTIDSVIRVLEGDTTSASGVSELSVIGTDWIDEFTRAISIQVLAYNYNLDLVTKLSYFWEISLVGDYVVSFGTEAAALASTSGSKIAVYCLLGLVLLVGVALDVDALLALFVAPSRNLKRWVLFTFGEVYIYTNLALYALFVALVYYEASYSTNVGDIRSFMSLYMPYSNPTPWSDSSIGFSSLYTRASDFFHYRRVVVVLTGIMVFIGLVNVVTLYLTSNPFLRTLSEFIFWSLVSFSLILIFVAVGIFFMIYVCYGDYIKGASTPLGAVEISLLYLYGQIDFEQMILVDYSISIALNFYITILPLLLLNLATSVFVVEIPHAVRNLRKTGKLSMIRFTWVSPLKFRRPRCCGGQDRRFVRPNKYGLCSCIRILGNRDIENPFIWAYNYAQLVHEDGTLVDREGFFARFRRRFFRGLRIDTK